MTGQGCNEVTKWNRKNMQEDGRAIVDRCEWRTGVAE